MRWTLPLTLALLLAGCGVLRGMAQSISDDLNTPETAPTLASAPTSSGCYDQKCQTLDAIEARGYELARAGKISWTQLVDKFYQVRAQLYPNSNDSHGAGEIRAYQRTLAEQMDAKRITEAQWAYLIENQLAAIRSRNQVISNSAPRQTHCVTTNLGTTTFPRYETTCK